MAKEESKQKDTLRLAMDSLEKEYGKGIVINSSFKATKIDVVSSGSFGLDIATGIGGFPRGKIVEFIGWESSGKSTVTLETIANAQKDGLECLLIDGEHSFDKKYATALGVDVDALHISQPDYGEMGYDVARKMIETGKIGVLVIDSQTSLLPKKQMEGDAGDSALGLHARLLSTEIPKLMNAAKRSGALVIIISQLREKIGVMFGSPETTNGGNALKFYAHMRLRFSKVADKENELNTTTVKIIKNKLAAPFKEAKFDVLFGIGIDRIKEIINFAVDLDIIQKSGSWYAWGTSKIGQGIDAVKTFLDDNPEVKEEIKTQVLNKLAGNETEEKQEEQQITEPDPGIANGDTSDSNEGEHSDISG